MAEKKNIFQKAAESFFGTQGKPNIPKDYKIKYDDSLEEVQLLGFASEEGVVIDRDGYSRYRAVINNRRSICEMPDFEKLKKEGIVDEKGEVLDEKRFNDYKKQKHEIEVMKYMKEMEM